MLLSSFLLFCLIQAAYSLNNRPIIGIIGQKPLHPTPGINGTSYINADYVKYLESAGARVVPIPIDISKDELKKLFSFINGLLLPGGDADLMDSGYRRNAEFVFNLAMEEYDEGNYFPIWGTCLGMQLMTILPVQSDVVISSSSGTWDKSMYLNFTKGFETSRMFSNIPDKVIHILERESITYNAHYNCVSIDSYRQYPRLHSFFKVLSTNQDSNGKIFLSTIEAVDYPFYGVQWHPELSIFEFNINAGLGKHINHSGNAVLSAQAFAMFFVNEARKSEHRFPNKKLEEQYLIYNYESYHAGIHGWFDEQIYIF